MTMFSYRDGLFFDRMDGGAVRIVKTDSDLYPHDNGDNIDVDITIDSDSWASIITAVSAGGDTSEQHERAKAFHG